MAGRAMRVAARGMDAAAEAVLAVVTLVVFGDSHRPWTSTFLVVAAICLYEALGSMWLGASPGKRLTGLRLVSLDRPGRARPLASLQRGAVSAAFTVLPPIGLLVGIALMAQGATRGDVDAEQLATGVLLATGSLGALSAWAGGTVGDALGRGFADRLAGTMVTPDRFVGVVATRDLPGYADGARPPRISPLGRVADLDIRARARLRRLDDSRLLAAAVGLLALTASLPMSTRTALLASSVTWILIFVVHETRLVHRTGQTPGHELALLRIVDRRTGRPPGTVRAAARAIVLGLTLYVPPLWPILGISLLLMRFGGEGRGLHDLAGRTVVVFDADIDPEALRQRAMRMRLGRAG